MANLKVYRDDDRFIIGRPEWQGCHSMTYGVAVAFSRREAAEIIAECQGKSAAELDAMKRLYWTDGRFEEAEERGLFGAAW